MCLFIISSVFPPGVFRRVSHIPCENICLVYEVGKTQLAWRTRLHEIFFLFHHEKQNNASLCNVGGWRSSTSCYSHTNHPLRAAVTFGFQFMQGWFMTAEYPKVAVSQPADHNNTKKHVSSKTILEIPFFTTRWQCVHSQALGPHKRLVTSLSFSLFSQYFPGDDPALILDNGEFIRRILFSSVATHFGDDGK